MATDFTTRLLALTHQKRIAFGLLVFERMLPTLALFSKETGFDPSCYLQAREAMWDAILHGQINDTVRHLCAKNIPDTESFSSELSSFALNATLVMNEIMEYIIDHESAHFNFLLTLPRDSVYLYLSSLEPTIVSSTKKDYDDSPLMRRERHQQEEDLRLLSSLPDEFDNQIVEMLKARAIASTSLLETGDRRGKKGTT